MKQYLPLSKFIATFTIENIVKRSLNALFLAVRNSRKILSKIKDIAAVNALVYAWASPLRFYSTWQCEKPLVVGLQRVRIPALSFCAMIMTGEGSTRYD